MATSCGEPVGRRLAVEARVEIDAGGDGSNEQQKKRKSSFHNQCTFLAI